MNKKYYALEQIDKKAEIYIFGSISTMPWRDKDRDAYGIVKEIQALDVDEIHVYINSTGGSVSEGLAIYNVLKNQKAKIHTYDCGFACSAASVVFMAGEERVMFDSSLLMIHNAWTYASGNAATFRKQADDLDTITQASVKAYMEKVSISEEEVKRMMDNETWISAEQAKEYGFATRIYEEKEEGTNQSAMQSIHDVILQKGSTEKITAQEIAQEVVKLIKTEKKEEINNSSWANFFGGK